MFSIFTFFKRSSILECSLFSVIKPSNAEDKITKPLDTGKLELIISPSAAPFPPARDTDSLLMYLKNLT